VYSDDEMMIYQLVQDEANITADDEEKFIIISGLLRLRAQLDTEP
jgi:hypothetical protein